MREPGNDFGHVGLRSPNIASVASSFLGPAHVTSTDKQVFARSYCARGTRAATVLCTPLQAALRRKNKFGTGRIELNELNDMLSRSGTPTRTARNAVHSAPGCPIVRAPNDLLCVFLR